MDVAKNFCLPPGHPWPGFKPDVKSEAEFALKDGNGDDRVDFQEFVRGANRKEIGERYAQFERYDTNNDGKLTKDEFVRGKRMDAIRDAFPGPILRPTPILRPEPVTGLNPGKYEPKEAEGSGLFGKLLKGLAFTNPITAPIALSHWVGSKLFGK